MACAVSTRALAHSTKPTRERKSGIGRVPFRILSTVLLRPCASQHGSSTCVSFGHVALILDEFKSVRKSRKIFHGRRKLIASQQYLQLFATCVRADLQIRLATLHKSVRNYCVELHRLASTFGFRLNACLMHLQNLVIWVSYLRTLL